MPPISCLYKIIADCGPRQLIWTFNHERDQIIYMSLNGRNVVCTRKSAVLLLEDWEVAGNDFAGDLMLLTVS